jgi:hypothetical protein
VEFIENPRSYARVLSFGELLDRRFWGCRGWIQTSLA